MKQVVLCSKMKNRIQVGDLVRLKSFYGNATNRTCYGTVVEIDGENMALVHWWDSTIFIPNPSMEKSNHLIVVCRSED